MGRLAIGRNVKLTISAAPLYPGGGEFIYRRDAMGFRGAGVDPARVNILILGGSTTIQRYLPEEATWQAMRSLRRAGHSAVVANGGVDGQSTVGIIADLELWIPSVPHLGPRLVLVYAGINDVHLRTRGGIASISRSVGESSRSAAPSCCCGANLAAYRSRLAHIAEPPVP